MNGLAKIFYMAWLKWTNVLWRDMHIFGHVTLEPNMSRRKKYWNVVPMSPTSQYTNIMATCFILKV